VAKKSGYPASKWATPKWGILTLVQGVWLSKISPEFIMIFKQATFLETLS
jgi:hypothetical protein